MLDWIVTAVMAAVTHAEVGGGQNGTVVIDLLNMQWWQGITALLVALGLSPAPWILGLATNKIQFTSTADAAHQRELDARERSHEEQQEQLREYHAIVLASKEERYADLVSTNARNVEVADQQKQRGDKLQGALGESTKALEMTNHILTELRQSAEEVTPSG